MITSFCLRYAAPRAATAFLIMLTLHGCDSAGAGGAAPTASGGDLGLFQDVLKQVEKSYVEPVSDSEGDALMIFPGGDDPVLAKVADLARAHGWEVTGLRVERGRLDDVFREITTVPQEPAPAAA